MSQLPIEEAGFRPSTSPAASGFGVPIHASIGIRSSIRQSMHTVRPEGEALEIARLTEQQVSIRDYVG